MQYVHVLQCTDWPAKTSESWVNAVGTVGGSHDDHMTTLLQAIHESEQLGYNTSLHLSMGLGGTRAHMREEEGKGMCVCVCAWYEGNLEVYHII